MASRWNWARTKLEEVFEGGSKFRSCSGRGGVKRSLLFIRLLKYGHAEGSFGSRSTREQRRRAAPTDSADNHLQSETTLEEAVASLISRVHRGIAIDSYRYNHVLKRCFKQKDLQSLKQVHDCIKKSGLEKNKYVANNLLKCYIGCGKLEIAQELFNRFSEKCVVSWTTMIGGYAENDQGEDAVEVYKQFRSEGGQPNAITYLTVLKACASAVALNWGKNIHTHILHDGFQGDIRVCNALVSMYAKCGGIEDARSVFDSMERRNIISWNAMIGGLAQHGRGLDAFSLFNQMQREGFTPDSVTYLCIFSTMADPEDLVWVKKVHSHAFRSGLEQHLYVNSALIHIYAKCGSVEDAKLVFDSLVSRDLICWNAMIGAFARHGLGHEAFSLFLRMEREGIIPDSVTYMNILNPCSSNGALEWVKEVHAHATRAGLDIDLCVGNALVHMYAKIGTISEARQVFDKMLARDVVTWTVMLGGLAQHGHGRVGTQLFEEMKAKGVKPSETLFVTLLSACSHAGLVDEGRFYFFSMARDYDIIPSLGHYNCMVDMLGRAGHLEEAKLFLLNIPIKPDIITWNGLLGACRVFNNLKLGELAAKECLKLEPMKSSSYVLLSNIYAAVGNWDQVSLIRNMMQERGIRKNPGRCWIEVDNEVHHFLAGDTSHPEGREIRAMLNSLLEKIKAEGYIPDTRRVLLNVEEEDKESVLCSHSEKLAIAYGLMHVHPEKPIRIYKNLRICRDCHTATKMISKITGREIVARDANRFHLFKGGSCSCGDYW